MNSTNHIQPIGAKATADAAEVAGGGPRAFEVAVVSLLVLVFCPPLLTLTVVAAFSALAVTALVTAAAAVIAVPVMLVRRVRMHHRTHRSTLFVHRMPRLQRARR